MTILITGGTGFIGSHTVVSLLKSGFNAVILDNLCNSSANILPRLEKITGQAVPFTKEISVIVKCCVKSLQNTILMPSSILPA